MGLRLCQPKYEQRDSFSCAVYLMLQHQSFDMGGGCCIPIEFCPDYTYVSLSILSRNPYFGRQFLPQGVARDQRTGNISWLVGPPAPAANKHWMKSTFFSAAAAI